MAFNNRQQNVPPLFMEIIKNDEQRGITKACPVVSFKDAKQLHIEHRDLMRAAEKATAGTKDKGKSY